MNGFAACLAFVLSQEGAFSNNPSDPGGATFRGITLSTYREFAGNAHLSVADLRVISDAEISAIYRKNYYTTCRCESLPSGVDLVVFDAAVNMGVKRSIELLQKTLNVSVDGQIGDQTLAAVRRIPAPQLINKLIDAQMTYYKQCAEYDVFGVGWETRAERRRQAALKLVPL